jgi:hypothetical protein
MMLIPTWATKSPGQQTGRAGIYCITITLVSSRLCPTIDRHRHSWETPGYGGMGDRFFIPATLDLFFDLPNVFSQRYRGHSHLLPTLKYALFCKNMQAFIVHEPPVLP